MKSADQQAKAEGLPESLLGNVIENRYKIERYLAAGSFGYVYAARHQILGHSLRRVAFKLLKQPDMNRKDVSESMKDALVVASLAETHTNHPDLKKIIHIYDIGICEDWNNRGYIVMEYVAGDLQKEIRKSKGLPVNLAIHYTEQICRGVRLSHKIDPPVVHRDLKPANVLITPEGKVKVTDFGLAKTVGFRTKSTEGAGDLMCQAPESLEGTCTTRSDVYSIGLMLYEMLTGEHPFADLSDQLNAAKSMDAKFEIHKQARKKGIPDLRSKNPLLRNFPLVVETIHGCCENDPEKRSFKDAAELLDSLTCQKVIQKQHDTPKADPISALLSNAKAAQASDPLKALKFIDQLISKSNPGKHRNQLMDAYFLKGRILGKDSNASKAVIDQAQKALFIAHRDYGHPLASALRKELLLKLRHPK